MRRFLAVATAMLISGVAFGADPVSIDVENFTAERGISTLVLKVTNNTTAHIDRAYIDCAFLTEDERPIDIGKALVTNLAAGGHAYDKASIPTTDGVAKADCRVVNYR